MAWVYLLIFVAAVATRLPFIGEYLINWDAVQYALGLVEFDVTQHQPHPPGSILYVGLGHIALGLAGEANRALTLISVLAGAASCVLCYVLGRQMFGGHTAALGAALYFFSPLTWFYGVVALPYALEGALALAAVALSWRAAEDRDYRAATAGALVLALAGGVRQTTLLLLLPLWIFATWRATRGDWRRLALAAGVLGTLCLAWVVPLLALSGGPVAYVTASRRLSSLVSGLTSVFAHGLPALAANVTYLGDVAGTALNLSLVTFLIVLLPGVRWPWQPDRAQRWFLWLWAAPPVAVYVLFHVGQAGYLLLVFPLACFAAASAALTIASMLSKRRGWPADRIAAVIAAALTGTSAAIFLFSPLIGDAEGGLSRNRIARNDAWLCQLRRELAALPPSETVLMTGTRSAESFRHATYYFPDYLVLAFGFDRERDLGIAFEGQRGRHTYAHFMAGDAAAETYLLPPGTRRFAILDEPVSRLLPEDELEEVALTPSRTLWLWPATGSPAPEIQSFGAPRYARIERRAP